MGGRQAVDPAALLIPSQRRTKIIGMVVVKGGFEKL
jgi:hypothetical protein